MSKQELATIDPLFQQFAAQQQKEAADLASGQRVVFPSLRIGTVQQKKSTLNVVEVVNPAVRDEQNNAQVTQFEDVRIVVLGHVPIRRLRYGTPDGKMVTSLFSVGPRRGSYAIGKAINGALPWEEVEARWPDGFKVTYVEYGSNQAKTGLKKPESRHYLVVGLQDEKVREAAGSDIAFVGLSMSSTYGIKVDRPGDYEELSYTLMGFPKKDDPDANKGVFHKLLTRPWEAGIAAGLPEDATKGTPQSAIWLNMLGLVIGDIVTAVPGFEIGDELDRDELAWAAEAKVRGRELMQSIIEQETRDAWGSIAPNRLPEISEAAVNEDWDAVAQAVRLAAPFNPEIVEEEVPEVESEDLEAAPPPPTQSIDDEFPPEEELPFD